MSAHKFSDSDLRRDPVLLSKAIEYARKYVGDFEFMVNAQAMVINEGTLTLPVARGVLNCMRTDPSLSPEQRPTKATTVTESVDNVIPFERPEPEPKPKSLDLRLLVDLPVKLKEGVVLGHSASQGKAHTVLHRIRTDDITARWERDYYYNGQTKERTYSPLQFKRIQLLWHCSSWYVSRSIPLTLDMARETNMPLCRSPKCFTHKCGGCGYINRIYDLDDVPQGVDLGTAYITELIPTCHICGRVF